MKKLTTILICAVATLAFTSCKKNASGPAGVDFQLQASNSVVAVNRSEAASVNWTAGTSTPSLVKIEAKSLGADIEFTSNSTQSVDLFNTAQTFGGVTLPEGTYNQVELRVNLSSLQLSGTFNNGTTNIPVSFQLNTPIQIKTESSDVNVQGGSFTALTRLNLTTYMSGITLSAMNSATLTSGTIVISATSNTPLYNIILTNINTFHHTDFNHH